MEGYQLSTSEYAKRERVSAMTIRRWKAKGAPLDDPDAMLVFRANEKSRTRVSKNNHRHTSSSTPSCAPDQPKPVKKTQTDPSRAEVEKHIGMSAGIKRLQAVEVLLALDYEDARKSRDMERPKTCREEWLAVFEQLRKIEKERLVLESFHFGICPAPPFEVARMPRSILHAKFPFHRAFSQLRASTEPQQPEVA